MATPFSERVKTVCIGFPHFCLSLNCRSHVPFPQTSPAFSPPTKLPFTSPSHDKNGSCTSGSCPFELGMQRACKRLLYNSLQCLKTTASSVSAPDLNPLPGLVCGLVSLSIQSESRVHPDTSLSPPSPSAPSKSRTSPLTVCFNSYVLVTST